MDGCQGVGCHKLIETRMFGVALGKLGVLQSPGAAVTVKGDWAQRVTQCKALLRDRHKVVALQTNQQLSM